LNGDRIKVRTIGFIPHAERRAIPAASGEAVLDFVFADPEVQGMQSFIFRKGEVLQYPGFVAGFKSDQDTPLRFYTVDNELFLLSEFPVQETTMGSEEVTDYAPG